jgi:hypothetical protein
MEQVQSNLEQIPGLPPALASQLMTSLTQHQANPPFFPVAPEVPAAHKALQEAILTEFSSDPVSLFRAVTARMDWINGHAGDYSKDTLQLWTEWLHGSLCRRSIRAVDELPLDLLLRALEHDDGSEKVLGLCQKSIGKHGWDLALVDRMRSWIPRFGVAASTMIPRAKAEWCLWFEGVAPIQLDACWSHYVKQDLRSMAPQEAAAWRALLDNSFFMISGKAPNKWVKAGEALFPKVGADNFRRRFVAWFEPFAKGDPLRLTVVGRNVLRLLMWYALIARDRSVDDALLGFAHVQWKTKDSAKRAAIAEMAFSYVLSQRAPESAIPVLEKLVESGQAFEGSATHRIYGQLCADKNREPVAAIKPKSAAQKTAGPSRLIDSEPADLMRTLAQMITSRPPSK